MAEAKSSTKNIVDNDIHLNNGDILNGDNEAEGADDTATFGTFQEVKIGKSVMPRRYDSSLTTDGKKGFQCHCPIFLPFGSFIFYWNLFLCVIIMYSIIEIPFELAFQVSASPKDPIAILGFLIDLCLLFDIFLNFRTAYIDKYDRLRIIGDPKLIAKHYLSTWFIIDFLAATPFSYIILIFSEHNGSSTTSEMLGFFRLLRILKLLRIVKILKMFHHFRERSFHIPNMDARRNRTFLRLLRIVMTFLLIAHYFACFWYGIGLWAFQRDEPSWIDGIYAKGDGEKSNFIKYSYAFYWSIVTLFTTGYGDIVAHNVYEQWTCSLAILIGSTCSAYFIGVLTTGLGDDLSHQSRQQRVEQSLSFCAHYDLPKELRRAVLTHMRYFNTYNYLFEYQMTMNSLPNHLQKQISRYLATSVLKELDIFESLPASVVGEIALRLKAKSVGADQVLFERGEIGRELYIQRTGKSKLIYEGTSTKSISRILRRGDVVGEEAILSRTRTSTVVCIVWSEFYVLDIEDIVTVLRRHYDIVTAKNEWNKIKNTIRTTKSEGYYFKSSGDLNDAEIEKMRKHRHVRFKTLDMSKFEPFAEQQFTIDTPKRTKSSPSDSTPPFDRRTFSQYEQDLELEDERERMKHKKSMDDKDKVSFKSLKNIFMDKQKSHSRNKKQMKHYKKLQKDKTLQYSHVPVEELVFVSTPNLMDTNDNSHNIFEDQDMECMRSAGFFSSNDIFRINENAQVLDERQSVIIHDNTDQDRHHQADQKMEEEATEETSVEIAELKNGKSVNSVQANNAEDSVIAIDKLTINLAQQSNNSTSECMEDDTDSNLEVVVRQLEDITPKIYKVENNDGNNLNTNKSNSNITSSPSKKEFSKSNRYLTRLSSDSTGLEESSA